MTGQGISSLSMASLVSITWVGSGPKRPRERVMSIVSIPLHKYRLTTELDSFISRPVNLLIFRRNDRCFLTSREYIDKGLF